MHARVSTLQGDPKKLEDGISYFRDQVVPSARKQRGFKGARLLVDRSSGTVQAVTLWEDAAAVQASEAAMNQSRTQGAQLLGATAPTTEVFEMAVFVDA
jgi:heme-degrading monooxygenase HmoA